VLLAQVFAEKMVGVREDLETQFKAQEEALLAKIDELEAKAAAAAGGAAGATPKVATPKSGTPK
jgi:BMFP domain-containing protein YqiC